jgi:hypothetical protein
MSVLSASNNSICIWCLFNDAVSKLVFVEISFNGISPTLQFILVAEDQGKHQVSAKSAKSPSELPAINVGVLHVHLKLYLKALYILYKYKVKQSYRSNRPCRSIGL